MEWELGILTGLVVFGGLGLTLAMWGVRHLVWNASRLLYHGARYPLGMSTAADMLQVERELTEEALARGRARVIGIRANVSQARTALQEVDDRLTDMIARARRGN